MSTTEPAPPAPPARRASRWLWVALTVSLALNLLVAGSIAGFAWRHHAGWGGPGAFLGWRLMRELPDDKRDAVKALLDRDAPAIRQAFDTAGAARRDAMRIFEAEPFDRVAFDAALARAGGAEAAASKAMYALFGEVGQSLTQDERRRVLRSMRGRWWGMRRHGGDLGDGPGGG